MNITELIEHLTQLKNEHGDKDVVLKITDHTDWDYNFYHPGFIIDTVYDDGDDGEFDEDTEYCICGISI
jgi:hypothetical protein